MTKIEYRPINLMQVKGYWYAMCNCRQYKTNGLPYPGHAEAAVFQHIRDKHGQSLTTTRNLMGY